MDQVVEREEGTRAGVGPESKVKGLQLDGIIDWEGYSYKKQLPSIRLDQAQLGSGGTRFDQAQIWQRHAAVVVLWWWGLFVGVWVRCWVGGWGCRGDGPVLAYLRFGPRRRSRAPKQPKQQERRTNILYH